MPNFRSHDIFVLHEFNESVKNLRLSNDRLNESVSIAATLPTQYRQTCLEIDQEIIEKIDEINQIKREIIEISQRAYNNISGITSVGITSSNMPSEAPFSSYNFQGKVPNDETGTNWYSCKVSANTSSYDVYNFISPDTVETFQAHRGEVEEAGRYYLCGDTLRPEITECVDLNGNIIDPQQQKITYKDKISTITRAPIYPDTLRAWYFENLETVNSSVINPLEPGEYQTLATNRNNLGIGKTSVSFFNQESNGIRNYTGSLGFFYNITGPSDIPAHKKNNSNRNQICSIRAQINPLMARINGLRARITELATGVSAIKDAKTNEQLAEWSLSYAIRENNRRINTNNLSIRMIEDKYD
jgi:prefoldin subunit 5